MATIGSFKKIGDDYQGEIATLAVQAKNVRIVPIASDTNRSRLAQLSPRAERARLWRARGGARHGGARELAGAVGEVVGVVDQRLGTQRLDQLDRAR